MDYSLIYTAIGTAGLALAFALYKSAWIRKQDPGDAKLQEIGAAIREGAMAFLAREYKALSIFVLAVAALLIALNHASLRLVGLSFLAGAICSGLAGYFGMRVATMANMRTANRARFGLQPALEVAFSGGAVMGLCVAGLGLLGLAALFWLYVQMWGEDLQTVAARVLPVLSGFSLGASSIALFARVGGGIYTKAADVGADLVGKVEAGIPEDDPRNPAVIADNVGDNVGDVAGMGADLFESYVGAILGSMVLGAVAAQSMPLVLLPLAVSAVGILASVAGTFLVRTREGGNPQNALNMGTIGAGVLLAAAAWPLIHAIAPAEFQIGARTYTATGIYCAVIAGLLGGILVGLFTEFHTAEGRRPVIAIADSSTTGPATNIIAGLGVGMMSTVSPILTLAVSIVASHHCAGIYGVAIAALGMLATTGVQLAVDAYGPIADNAGGLAQMAKLDPEVRRRTDKLDAVGNTTAAIGKGFAIGSAALTALALFAAFEQSAGISEIDVTKSTVMAGVLIGAMMPFFFSALAIGAVGRAAHTMIGEVRRQFREVPGLLEGRARPDYARCVDISTRAAIREMVAPGLIAIAAPIAVGYFGRLEMLGGLLCGVLVSGVLIALFMANSGGAWDNAKKYIEEGHFGGKGSDAHKAAVIGDTVGDPFKDTAGPSINILIKLMCIVSLIIAPMLVESAHTHDSRKADPGSALSVETPAHNAAP
ncbi:MAG: sodium-translocating pyrophosphatase [Kiritimatiellae bacterium]|nr:sodium-translocating pyrophosphatase [Kiritimatiellia bacterium]MDW8458926.1 sodium-translocating pyrophosphatase [Verrucomicrobiota bacterium]